MHREGGTMRRGLLVALVTVAMVVTLAGTALAGEWNQGHFNAPGGNIPARDHANSECLYNGQDEADVINGGGEEEDPVVGYDDFVWGATPAGAHNEAGKRVQSGGQLIAAGFIPAGSGGAGQGLACNGHLNPQK